MKLGRRPESNAYPENRVGTKTYKGYTAHMLRGNIPAFSKIVAATPRLQKKVMRLIDGGAPIPACGRQIRAVYRYLMRDYGEYMDAKFYG